MFSYPVDSEYAWYEPRIRQSSYPRTRNFFGPAQYFRPCSYYHNNVSPFYYSSPQYYYDYDYDDEEDQKEQLLRELLSRKIAHKQQEERERERQERLKKLYESKAAEEQSQQSQQSQQSEASPKRSFKVKIQGGDEETKSDVEKSQAARKIFNFIKNQSANRKTYKILDKFHTLRMIENELKEVRDTKVIESLTFDEKHEKKVLPTSAENKRFLEYEDKILKLFDKLDRVQSEGIDIIRERRRLLVKSAQALLDELDNEKDEQWKAFSEKELNSDVVMDDAVLPDNEGNDVIIDEKQSIPTSNMEPDNLVVEEQIQE